MNLASSSSSSSSLLGQGHDQQPQLSVFDMVIISLSSLHLLFSLSSALFLLHFHHLHLHPSTSSPLRRLNSLWPVRLLLLLFSSLLSLFELLRLPIFPLLLLLIPRNHNHQSTTPDYICKLYTLSSQSFAQPAFLSTLLFLLRASTSPQSPNSPFLSALVLSFLTSLPFLLLPYLILRSIPPYILPTFLIPLSPPDRCAQPLFGTMLLALLGAVYVPLFVSACWTAVTVVINKKLRVRLYVLAGAVVVALSGQVVVLALAALWVPGSVVSQGLGVAGFVFVLGCVVVGEVILVVLPVVDALAIVEPEKGCGAGCGGPLLKGKELELRV